MEITLIAREGVGKTPSRGLVIESQTVHSVNRKNNVLQVGDEPYSSISLTHLLFCIVYYIGERESYIWD
jgi:hypothetical protein